MHMTQSPTYLVCGGDGGGGTVLSAPLGGLHRASGVTAARLMSGQHLAYHNYTRSFQMLVILKPRAKWGSTS